MAVKTTEWGQQLVVVTTDVGDGAPVLDASAFSGLKAHPAVDLMARTSTSTRVHRQFRTSSGPSTAGFQPAPAARQTCEGPPLSSVGGRRWVTTPPAWGQVASVPAPVSTSSGLRLRRSQWSHPAP